MAKHMISNLWGREPAGVLFLVQATIAGAVSFGLKLTGEQTAAIMTFSSALIAVVTRQSMGSPATMAKLKADVAASSKDPPA
jgi:hypothetical protein